MPKAMSNFLCSEAKGIASSTWSTMYIRRGNSAVSISGLAAISCASTPVTKAYLCLWSSVRNFFYNGFFFLLWFRKTVLIRWLESHWKNYSNLKRMAWNKLPLWWVILRQRLLALLLESSLCVFLGRILERDALS